jgi:hypothetical protein
MPEEAKESTTAIRRAVGEQIKALKELSEIVAKSGRTVDVSEPQPRPARTINVPEPEPRPVRTMDVAAELTPRPAPPPPLPSAEGELQLAAPRQRDVPREAPEKPRSNGWVQDLLSGAARAEREEKPAPAPEPARQPARQATALSSLSADIARAVDQDAMLDLWDRHRRGERGVFSRRLYTLKGQQTFDDIRQRYMTDPEFARAVTRYCDDYEALLKDVSKNDRDGSGLRSYLVSDTGKVYTLLAHAAGRLR